MVQQQEVLDKIIKLYPLALLFLVLTLIISHFFYTVLNPVFIGKEKEIYIKPGMKIKDIGFLLEKEGIIKSRFYFNLITTIKKSKIKAGFYKFYGFYNIFKVIEELEGGGKGIKITIPEGKTLKEIEKIFANNGFKVNFSNYQLKHTDNEILKKYFSSDSSLEGFLFPDTYEFYKEDNEKTIINKLVNNFEKKALSEILKNENLNPYETLILASIVEKEAKKESDFPVIAGILLKRLKNEKPLEADATLVYYKCQYIFCDYELKISDLKEDHPYNTYKYKNLPPTPISNPGILAIKSVINPVTTDYWYYLTDKEGNAHYAKTLKEHQENIKKYLKK